MIALNNVLKGCSWPLEEYRIVPACSSAAFEPVWMVTQCHQCLIHSRYDLNLLLRILIESPSFPLLSTNRLLHKILQPQLLFL